MPGRNGCIQALILASALTLCERPLSARMKDLELMGARGAHHASHGMQR